MRRSLCSLVRPPLNGGIVRQTGLSMKSFLGTVSAIIFALGIATGLLGVVMVGYGILAPKQPPPSLNEGHGYAFVFGIVVAFIGLGVAAVGRAIDSAVTRQASPRGAAEPAVAAAERPSDPPDRS